MYETVYRDQCLGKVFCGVPVFYLNLVRRSILRATWMGDVVATV